MSETLAGPARRGRLRPVRGRVRGRAVAVIAVIAVAVVVGIVDGVVAVPARPALVAGSGGVQIVPAGSYASSAFCAGGTVGSSGPASSTIYLTNTTDHAVSGVMTSTVAPGTEPGTSGTSQGTAASPVRRSVEVPALGAAAVNPATGLGAGYEATSFTFAGGGVAVNQVVSGPGGWSAAPCASRTSSSSYFAGGSTTQGNTLTLGIFNPAATPAVVDVSFLTGSGVIVPQSYQGLVVPAGQLVTENVGDFVQNQSEIATAVSAQSGAVVASQTEQWSSGATGGLGLQLGAPSLSERWYFAQTTNSPSATVTFHLANPGNTGTVATLSVGLSAGSVVPVRVPIPAQSAVTYVASGSVRMPSQIPYALSVYSPIPIVVGRSVEAGAGATPPVWGSTAGTPMAAPHWLVPGPGVTNAPGTANATVESLAVADPGPVPARVVVTVLGAARPVASFTVAPHSLGVLDAKLVSGLDAYDVRSSVPVTVEEDSGPAGAPGVVSTTGLPFAG